MLPCTLIVIGEAFDFDDPTYDENDCDVDIAGRFTPDDLSDTDQATILTAYQRFVAENQANIERFMTDTGCTWGDVAECWILRRLYFASAFRDFAAAHYVLDTVDLDEKIGSNGITLIMSNGTMRLSNPFLV